MARYGSSSGESKRLVLIVGTPIFYNVCYEIILTRFE